MTDSYALGPVQTASGDRLRQRALAVLEPRFATLAERSRRERLFSEIERQHMESLRVTLRQLEAMAPLEAPATEIGNLPLLAAIR